MKLKISKGDTVELIAGKDKSRSGAVLAIDSTKMLIKVQGLRMQTHFDKENGKSEKEGFMDYSNVKLLQKKAKAGKAKKKSATK